MTSTWLLLLLPILAPVDPAPSEQGRVLLVGMDGMDALTTESFMNQGLLPNFARLRAEGAFAPMVPANPSQSPVSWASINTGRNPGKTGIFDFVRRFQTPSAPELGTGFQVTTRRPADEVWEQSVPTGSLVLLGVCVLAGLALLSRGVRGGRAPVVVLGLVLLVGGGWFFSQPLLIGRYLPDSFPGHKKLNKARPFWHDLSAAGVPFRGQGVIVDYPVPELDNIKILAGLGAPDAAGGLNTWAVYTTRESWERPGKTPKELLPVSQRPGTGSLGGVSAGSGGRMYRFDSQGDKLVSTLYGPQNYWQKEQLLKRRAELKAEVEAEDDWQKREALQAEYDDIRKRTSGSNKLEFATTLPLEVTRADGMATIAIGDQSQTVAMPGWSDWFELDFALNKILHVKALQRVWVEELPGGSFELFASPPQIDPREPAPGSQICWPPNFSAEIAAEIGLFETLGWACHTHGLKELAISDNAFVGDIALTMDWRERMLQAAVADPEWRVLFHFFGTPDRVQHMLYRHYDEGHPLHDPAAADALLDFKGEKVAAKDMIPRIYQEMDRIVGWLLDEVLNPEDTLILVSDHGFNSFRWEVNLNNWLLDQGFLTLKSKGRFGESLTRAKILSSRNGTFGYIDWEKTQAYSGGLGKIFLNLQGREAKGIVPGEEADAVCDAIETALLASVDPRRGERYVQRVYRREEIYSGPYWKEDKLNGIEGTSELSVDFKPGYRVAWSSSGGKIGLVESTDPESGEPVVSGGDVVFDNSAWWSGDHCSVDLETVPAIFFSNQRLQGDGVVDVTDVAPTILQLVGVPIPADMDGQVRL